METVSFSTNAPEVKPPTMDRLMDQVRGLLHTQPGLMRPAVIGLCGVLLVLFVLRPVATQMTATCCKACCSTLISKRALP